ncbi:MAG: alpha-amylase family glycosyl hydrolase [Candidatus Kapaibacterium sp.]
MTEALNLIKEKISEIKSKNRKKLTYKIPNLWLEPYSKERTIEEVHPYEFFLNKIHEIEEMAKVSKPLLPDSDWVPEAVVYNLFPRFTAAFDHDADGSLALPANEDGFRETGTMLKCLALLPYFKSLRVNTIYMLPVTSIGIDGRKGTLGSPYAIRNPYKLDDNLAEPWLDLGVEIEMKAFIDAAHSLGMKVVMEFVFRTASIDSDLALEHPDWFYWIKSKIKDREDDPKNERRYGPPVFTRKELEKIYAKVNNGELKKLPEPHDKHIEMFQATPQKTARVEDKIRGLLNKKIECRVPGAFSDWPPDDVQPVWSDVTYLKLYDHPDFNYMAYNTVRMYDLKLMKNEYKVKELWENIINIIPHYQYEYGIDGVMIDMGHALPTELRSAIINKAREINPDFVFWEENFTLTQNSVDDGYDAVVGYMPFDQHIPHKMNEIIRMMTNKNNPIDFYATPETHNTPRAASRPGGCDFSRAAWVINCFLPTMLFIHTGYELGETMPVNTGLGFDHEQIKEYPPGKLPLFSEAVLPWDQPGMQEFMRHIFEIREKYRQSSDDNDRIQIIENHIDGLVLFKRIYRNSELLIALNMSPDNDLAGKVMIDIKGKAIYTISGKKIKYDDHQILLELKPFEFSINEIK